MHSSEVSLSAFQMGMTDGNPGFGGGHGSRQRLSALSTMEGRDELSVQITIDSWRAVVIRDWLRRFFLSGDWVLSGVYV